MKAMKSVLLSPLQNFGEKNDLPIISKKSITYYFFTLKKLLLHMRCSDYGMPLNKEKVIER